MESSRILHRPAEHSYPTSRHGKKSIYAWHVDLGLDTAIRAPASSNTLVKILSTMPERAPYVGPHQMNFSLPRRLAHQRSVSSLSTCSNSSRKALVPPPRSRIPIPILNLPTSASSARPSMPNQAIPPSPSPSELLVSLQNSYSRFSLPQEVPRLRADSTSTVSTLEGSLLELEELIQVMGTPLPLQLEFNLPEKEAPRPRHHSAVVRRSGLPEKSKGRIHLGLRWV
jgi:hypothetical protein